jgi:diguanylate cyclase (GGDEF)-like protein
MQQTGSWLCPTELDRARITEASERNRRARNLGAVAAGVALLAAAPFVGWWTLISFVLIAAQSVTLDWRLARSARPERVAMGSVLWTMGVLAVTIALTGGPASPLLPWIVIPTASAATRFRPLVMVVLGAVTAAVIMAATMTVDPAGFLDDPVLVIVTLALLVNVSLMTSSLMGAELVHRDRAVLDPLTGLLNRSSLATRMAELEEQARITGGSVCLIECDLDYFKRVNDTYGHERGDAVLRDAAYEMRKTLRRFELIYRIGGEEFLILLPGVGLDEGVKIAERVRRCVAAARPGELDLTVSAGVAAAAGDDVVYEWLFRLADAALLRAKRAGRNRVEAADEEAGGQARERRRTVVSAG